MKKLFLLLLPLLVFGESGEFLRVVDGDTLLLKNEQGIVICQASFIDTPESKENEKFFKDMKSCKNISKEEALKAGEESKEFAKNLLKNITKLEYKITRVLANENPVCHISLPKGTQVLINPTFSEIMVEQGYALPFVIYADDIQSETLIKLAVEAKEEKRGLWKNHEEYLKCLIGKRYSLRSLRD